MPVGFSHLRFALAFIVGLLSLAADRCAAQDRDRPLEVAAARIGFAGGYKAGRWTALTVELTGPKDQRGTAAVVGRDSDGVLVRYDDPAGAFTHTGGERTTLQLLFQAGSIGSRIELQLKLDGGPEWSAPLDVPGPLPSTNELVVTAGPKVGAEEMPRLVKRNPQFAYRNANVTEAAELPANRWGFDGVDWLVLPCSREGFVEQLSAEQITAVQDWVRGGGKLVVTAADRAAALFGEEGPWRSLAPGELGRATRLRSSTGLESAGGAALTFDTNDLGVVALIAELKQPRGRSELLEGGANNRVLAVRTPQGFGQVIFLALDLDQPPWREWTGRGPLLRSLLQAGRTEFDEEQQSNIRGQVTHLGYEDLTGQLRAALEQFPGVTFLSFTATAVIAVIYLLLIGPADYFLFQQLKLPRAGTWLTVTLLAVGCSALGVWLSGRTHGDRARVNRVEIVDFDSESGQTRGAAWVHLYSPVSRRYDLGWKPPQLESDEAFFTWQGLAGRGLGGLNARARSSFTSQPYAVAVPGGDATIHQAPLMISGSKAFLAGWSGRQSLPPQSLVVSPFGMLISDVQNPLPFELTECRVIYGEHLYRLQRPLLPGGKASLQELTPYDLESRLTVRQIIDQKDVLTAWDPALTDLPRIVDMLMFHEAANGAGYTGMVHRFQPQLDLSDHIRAGRAILVGKGPPQGTLVGDDLPAAEEQQRHTWLRVIVPVTTRRLEEQP